MLAGTWRPTVDKVWPWIGTALLVAVTVVVGTYGFAPEWLLRAEFARQRKCGGVSADNQNMFDIGDLFEGSDGVCE